MYSATTTSQFTDAILSSSIKGSFRQSVDKAEKQWKALGFEEQTTDKPFEEYVEVAGLGLPSPRLELQQAGFDAPKLGATARINLFSYGVNYAISLEAKRNKTITELVDGSKSVGESLATAIEILAADVFGNAFSTTKQLLPDGYCICSASHKTPRGTTFSTTMGAVSFSETGIETALILCDKMPTGNGIPGGVKPQGIVIPPDYRFVAKRILKSELQNNTANNAINALKDENLKIVVNRYLPSTSNWFVQNKVKNGLVCLWGERPNVIEVGMDLQRATVWSGNMMLGVGPAGNARVLLGSSV